MKNKLFLLFLLPCALFSVFAQTELIAGSDSTSTIPNLMLARSSADYRVTPGDVYTLSYAAANNAVTYVITVDSSYRIRVSNMGFVNGAGKTFLQLKNEIETLVANNYPLSGVQLVITQPASFNVHIRGELSKTGEVSVWALTRLSALLTPDNQTPYTSVRDVTVRSSNGQTQVYDLFNAQRLGDLSQNPCLRPGDVITFNRVKRVVRISGSVERPGNYQLLDGENIRELVEYYGKGFTADADRTRIELVRLANNEEIAGVKLFLTTDDLANNYTLENLDEITVPSTRQLQSVMFVEGAAGNTGTVQSLSASNRIIVRFNQGETYASLVRRNINWFSTVSDTQNAYILRNGERILIDLDLALYDTNYRGELIVHENDVLIIPFRQYFVSVTGAVIAPGRYPYIPDRDWEYYIGLAGGFMPGINTRNTVTIVDLNGRRMNKTDIITPETTITAAANHFLFYFNQYAPIITTTLTIITSFFTVWTFLNSR
jgi:protein involved in polysaccharide export with SLBB domain